MTDFTDEEWGAPPIRIPCPYCENGIAGVVTREMAMDAGVEYEPMIDQPIHCTHCKGKGWILDTEPLDSEE